MKVSTKEQIDAAVDKWVDSMTLTVASVSGVAFGSGNLHAGGYLKTGVSFDVTEQKAAYYAYQRGLRLRVDGEVPVTVISTDPATGKPLFTTQKVPWLADQDRDFKSKLYRAIEDGIRDGKPTGFRQNSDGSYPEGSIAADISKLMNVRRSQASTIARTETARAYYDGEMDRYREAGVTKLEYLGGPNACEFCTPLIGQIFDINDAPPLPLHPNCRCDYRPFADEYSEGGAEAPGDVDISIEEVGVEEPEGLKTIVEKQTSVFDRKPLSFGKRNLKPTTIVSKTFEAWGTEGGKVDPAINKVDSNFLKSNLELADKLVTDMRVPGLLDSVKYQSESKAYSSAGFALKKDLDGFLTAIDTNLSLTPALQSDEDISTRYARDVASLFHPQGTTSASIVTHEMGHVIEARIAIEISNQELMTESELLDMWRTNRVAEEICTTAYSSMVSDNAAEGRVTASIGTVRGGISKYAKQSFGETMAEAMADYYQNGDKARPYSKYIVQATKNKLDELELRI